MSVDSGDACVGDRASVIAPCADAVIEIVGRLGRSGVLEDLGERLQREHVKVQELRCLRVDLLLQAELRGGDGRDVTDTTSGDVVLSEGVGQAAADFLSVSELVG